MLFYRPPSCPAMTRTSPPLDASNTCTELPQAPSRYSNSHFDKKRKKCKLLTWIFKKELQLQRWEREAPGKPEAELLYQVLFFFKKNKNINMILLNLVICRRENTFCRICYYTTTNTDFDVSGTKMLANFCVFLMIIQYLSRRLRSLESLSTLGFQKVRTLLKKK